MDVYTMPFHTAASLEDVEQCLREALGGAMNAYGTVHRGALGARVWPRGVLTTEDVDDVLGCPAVGEVTWFVERGPDPDGYEEATDLMLRLAPWLAVDLDASAVCMVERDLVMMTRLGGELVLYDSVHRWAEPDIAALLPPHRRESGEIVL